MTANARTEANAKPTLRLKTEEFDRLWRVILGPMNVRQQAERLAIDHRHFSQLRTGTRNPGASFIAAVTLAMPNVPFSQIFDVVEAAEDADATDIAEPVRTGDAA